MPAGRSSLPTRTIAAALLGAVTLSGCAGVLPRSMETTQSPWDSFTTAKDAFDKIAAGSTTLEGLRKLGFDPDTGTNVRVLSYLDLQQRFMPTQSVTRADLDPSVRACIEQHDACSGLEVKPQVTERRRVGNAFLDVFEFQRETVTTGWSFYALVLLQDDTVVYKTWSGAPNIQSRQKETNPLGPLQDLGGFAADRAQGAVP